MTLSTWSITLALSWCFQRGHSCSKAIMCKQNCPFDMEVSHLWQVSHVINYDLPHNIDSYVHRIGHQLSWCQGSVNCGLDRSVGSHSREIAVISRVAGLHPVGMEIPICWRSYWPNREPWLGHQLLRAQLSTSCNIWYTGFWEGGIWWAWSVYCPLLPAGYQAFESVKVLPFVDRIWNNRIWGFSGTNERLKCWDRR